MTKEKYIKKIEETRYLCHSCHKELPDVSDLEWKCLVKDGMRLDFHLTCLWNHLIVNWIPYKN